MVLPIIMHSIIVSLSIYLFILFAWWWFKQKKATTIYGYTCFLMLGIALSHGGAGLIYMKTASIVHKDISEFVPDWWIFRHVFLMIPLILYASYATKKIRKNGHADLGRRSSDFNINKETDENKL